VARQFGFFGEPRNEVEIGMDILIRALITFVVVLLAKDAPRKSFA
jgi:hypothetical protein